MDNQILLSNVPNPVQGNTLVNNKKYFSKQNAPASQGANPSAHQNQTESTNEVKKKSPLPKSQRDGIYISTALGIIASLAILAKTSKNKYSLSIKKMISTPLRETFIGKEPFNVKEVMGIGAGSCLGGLLGGVIFDKDKTNRQAKVRESVTQYTNISLPILTVALFSKAGKFIQKKLPAALENGNKLQKMLYTTPKIISSMLGLGVGMIVGNKASNKLNQIVFKNKDKRPVEIGDFSAHLDDLCVASSYISEDNFITKSASRFVPLALMVAGTEIGCKQEDIKNKK